MTIDRRLVGTVLSEMLGISTLALLLYYLAESGASSIGDAWAVDRAVAYLLLFAAPLLIFLPLAAVLRLGPLTLLGAGSWALLGYVLIFVGAPDRTQADFFTYVAFLSLLFVALSSAFALPLAALSRRWLPAATASGGLVRAMREGGLLSLFVVALLAMSPLSVLNWLNAFLVFTVVALTEFFFLARD
jgi:hypothetical protein